MIHRNEWNAAERKMKALRDEIAFLDSIYPADEMCLRRAKVVMSSLDEQSAAIVSDLVTNARLSPREFRILAGSYGNNDMSVLSYQPKSDAHLLIACPSAMFESEIEALLVELSELSRR